MPRAEEGRRGRHRDRRSAQQSIWSKVARAGARTRRAAHASRAALVGEACARRRRRGDRRHRAVLPRTRNGSRRAAPFIAITGTNGKSTTTRADRTYPAHRRRRRVDARRQYRHGRSWSPSCPIDDRFHVIECSSLPDRPRAPAQSDGRHPDQSVAGTISTVTAPWSTTPP